MARFLATSLLAIVACPLLSSIDAVAVEVRQIDLFVGEMDGYDTYRIPAALVTPKGTVLAFCEGRRKSNADAGNIDILLKRSKDGGRTWSAQQLVWDDGDNTCGNPCAVVDQTTGTIWLLLTHNLGHDKEIDIIAKEAVGTRTVWVSKSEDQGDTWSKPVEVTSTTKDPKWGWYATGPGVGIQLRHGPHKGRLVIPGNHSYDHPEGRNNATAPIGPYEYGAHVIVSDDHGKTWRLGGVVRPKVNESQVVEIAKSNGALMINSRAYFNSGRRAVARSRDGGETWTVPRDDPALIEPVCQASLLRYSWPESDTKSRILFSNPASNQRNKMTVRLSCDEGRTWPVSRLLYPGPASYSCLMVLPDGRVGVLYERDHEAKITFASFRLGWLTGG